MTLVVDETLSYEVSTTRRKHIHSVSRNFKYKHFNNKYYTRLKTKKMLLKI